MDKTWFWHRFLDVANVPLASAIAQATEATGETMQVYIACATPTQGLDHDRASVLFDVQSPKLFRRKNEPGGGILSGVAASKDIAELATALRAISGALTRWQWIDVIVGAFFTRNPFGPDDIDKCAAMLQPFRPWMRATY
jgi:hypothetical protein